MKILVFGGAGKIGSAVAFDLARDDDVESVGIVGRSAASLERIKAWIGSDKVASHVLDIANSDERERLMDMYDLGVITLPDRVSSYRTVEAAIDAEMDVVDILEEYHRRPEAYETEGLRTRNGMSLQDYGEYLHSKAVRNGVTVLDGMGFAPGLSNITLGDGIRRIGAKAAVARVGGIPSEESARRHPLKYMITWSFAHVLREYMVKVKVIRDGRQVEVDAMSGREKFRFREFGKDATLECAITPGMPSFLYTRPHLNEFCEKTIRWPGHFEGIDALKDAGLLDLEPVDFHGTMVRPREFFLALAEPRLRPLPEDTDVCVMWNTAEGRKGGQRIIADYYMWAEADQASGLSAMSRVTGFSAAIGARMLGRGEIKDLGIVPPEDAIHGKLYEKFIKELKYRGIKIFEVTSLRPLPISSG